MFNESWIRFAVLMVVFGVILRVNGMIVLAALLLTVIPIAWAWNRIALWLVEYDRALSEHRVFVGETIDLSVSVTNKKLLPLAWVKIDDQFPARLTPENKTLEPSHIPLTAY